MSKANTQSAAFAAGLERIADDLESIAHAKKFIQRHTASFSAGGFLLSMLNAACNGEASFNQIAISLGRHETRSMSKQAVHARIGGEAVEYLQEVLQRLVKDRIGVPSSYGQRPFARILLQDSTQLKTHRANHKDFPALDNNSGRTAGAKLDWKYDVLSGEPFLPKQTAARAQDRTLGPQLLDEVDCGDLVLRDMGYFSLEGFRSIEAKGAWWISRLHGLVEVRLENGMDLEKHLQTCGGNRVDVLVLLGKAAHPARLTATRVPTHIAAMRRSKRRLKSKKQGHQPTRRALSRDDWTIHVTNIGSEMMDPAMIAATYRLRWEIEIKFRAWKQSADLSKALNRISNVHHLRAVMVAATIFFVLSMKEARRLEKAHPNRDVSFEKTCDWLAHSIATATGMAFIQEPDIRHLVFDRRKRPRLRSIIERLYALN